MNSGILICYTYGLKIQRLNFYCVRHYGIVGFDIEKIIKHCQVLLIL